MEHIKGQDIRSYISSNPNSINDIFTQSISAFCALEKSGILHRDIRPQNILVSDEGTLKIIDFGFGKQITDNDNFNKSISLNWFCEPPKEFSNDTYNFGTEIYFLGNLFLNTISNEAANIFNYQSLLHKMCELSPTTRYTSFMKIEQDIAENDLSKTEFTDNEIYAYRIFSDMLSRIVDSIDIDIEFTSDTDRFLFFIDDIFQKCMLEESVPNPSILPQCLIPEGTYVYATHIYVKVAELGTFIQMFKNTTSKKKRIILANLSFRLKSKPTTKNTFRSGLDQVPF